MYRLQTAQEEVEARRLGVVRLFQLHPHAPQLQVGAIQLMFLVQAAVGGSVLGVLQVAVLSTASKTQRVKITSLGWVVATHKSKMIAYTTIMAVAYLQTLLTFL
jgi:hypothetical protein